MGRSARDGLVQILSGLQPGETVVASGQFLLDSESRLREAIAKSSPRAKPTPRAPQPRPAGHARRHAQGRPRHHVGALPWPGSTPWSPAYLLAESLQSHSKPTTPH